MKAWILLLTFANVTTVEAMNFQDDIPLTHIDILKEHYVFLASGPQGESSLETVTTQDCS